MVSKKQESVTIFDTLLEANYLPMLKDSKYTSYISDSNISKMSGWFLRCFFSVLHHYHALIFATL